eukprot:gene12578-12708_t
MPSNIIGGDYDRLPSVGFSGGGWGGGLGGSGGFIQLDHGAGREVAGPGGDVDVVVGLASGSMAVPGSGAATSRSGFMGPGAGGALFSGGGRGLGYGGLQAGFSGGSGLAGPGAGRRGLGSGSARLF